MLNRVILVGRLTKDPDLRFTPNGAAVSNFTLAVNRPFSNQQGEKETDFINVVCWKKTAESVANFLKKGSLAGVDGRVQTRTYDGQDGKKVYVTEVLAESVQFLEPKGNGSQQENRSHTGQQSAQQTRIDDDPFSGGGQIDIDDSDLPF